VVKIKSANFCALKHACTHCALCIVSFMSSLWILSDKRRTFLFCEGGALKKQQSTPDKGETVS